MWRDQLLNYAKVAETHPVEDSADESLLEVLSCPVLNHELYQRVPFHGAPTVGLDAQGKSRFIVWIGHQLHGNVCERMKLNKTMILSV